MQTQPIAETDTTATPREPAQTQPADAPTPRTWPRTADGRFSSWSLDTILRLHRLGAGEETLIARVEASPRRGFFPTDEVIEYLIREGLPDRVIAAIIRQASSRRSSEPWVYPTPSPAIPQWWDD